MTDLTTLDYAPATELVEAIRTRRVSPVELLDDVLARAERLQDSVHAFVTLDAERARAAAKDAEAAVLLKIFQSHLADHQADKFAILHDREGKARVLELDGGGRAIDEKG